MVALMSTITRAIGGLARCLLDMGLLLSCYAPLGESTPPPLGHCPALFSYSALQARGILAWEKGGRDAHPEAQYREQESIR